MTQGHSDVSALSDADLARLADLLAEAIQLATVLREVDSRPYVELAATCAAERAIRRFRSRQLCGTIQTALQTSTVQLGGMRLRDSH